MNLYTTPTIGGAIRWIRRPGATIVLSSVAGASNPPARRAPAGLLLQASHNGCTSYIVVISRASNREIARVSTRHAREAVLAAGVHVQRSLCYAEAAIGPIPAVPVPGTGRASFDQAAYAIALCGTGSAWSRARIERELRRAKRAHRILWSDDSGVVLSLPSDEDGWPTEQTGPAVATVYPYGLPEGLTPGPRPLRGSAGLSRVRRTFACDPERRRRWRDWIF